MRSARSILCSLVAFVLLAAPAAAQQEVDATRLYLGAAGAACLFRVGSGVPSGGATCDKYLDTATGDRYVKMSDGIWHIEAPLIPRVTYTDDLGSATVRFRTLYAAELTVETLVAQNTIATIGGRILVAPTTLLTADLTAGATSITVKHNNLVNGDRVYLEAAGNVEWLAITSVASGSAGAYVYSVTRNLDGTGANQWYAGDAVLDTGTTGNGFLDLYSTGGLFAGTGPTIVGNVRTGTTYNNVETRWAIGNLNGLYGYASSTYGAAFGVPTGAWVKIDPVNGVRLGHNATTSVQIDASGNATFTGAITATTGAIGGYTIGADYIRDAANSMGMASTVTGGDDVRFWAGNTFANRGTAPFRVTEAGNGILGGFAFGVDYIIDGPNSMGLAATITGGDDVRFWAGSVFINRATAPFRVTESGAIVASNATITGAITATSGSFTGNGAGVTNIDGGNIQADTITATQIAANAITTSELNAGAVTAGKISVSNLSAISADIGTVTAGTIDGVTIVAGSGDEVTLDSSGVTFDAGTAGPNKAKWTDGSFIYSSGDVFVMASEPSVTLTGGSSSVIWTGNQLVGFSSPALGQSSNPWASLFLNAATTTSNYYPMVVNTGDWQLHRKTDGTDGAAGCAGVTDVAADRGILTSVTCTSPAQFSTSVEQTAAIQGLLARIAQLEQQVAQLLALKGSR